MYETHLTAVGTLITAVDKRRFADGTTKVHFRIACNERRFDRAQNGWTDGATLYMSVNCWRELADNVHASFLVGDPIIVRGRLITREWEKEGKRQSMTELEASAVGPDLSRCTAKIVRTKRGNGSPDNAAGVGGDASADRSTARASDQAAAPTWGGESRGASQVDDPWQTGTSGAEGESDPDSDLGDEVWPDGPASGDRGAAVEAAVGS